MKNILLVSSMLLYISASAQYNSKNLAMESPEPSGSTKYHFKNLQLYPIRANANFFSEIKDYGNYLSLKEGLEAKKVLISEKVDTARRESIQYNEPANRNNRPQRQIEQQQQQIVSEGTVNTLFIENVSADTVMVLAGEVVKGGKQDRVIAQDFLLYPKSGKKDVSVFCVEHGRWSTNDTTFAFKETSTISAQSVRKAAAVDKQQGKVWDNVAIVTSKNKASTSTGTYNALTSSESYNKELEEYVKNLGNSFNTDPSVIGVVAVSGDSIIGCDMFVSNPMFKKYYPNLLNSYATEAITNGKEVKVSYQQVSAYLNSFIANEEKQEEIIKSKGTQLKEGQRKVHISVY
ncbi:MAG: ARPP-1 family domain-containing protein [Cytophagaceae bacterium]